VELIKSVVAAALRLAPSSRERAPTTSDAAGGGGGSGGVQSEQLRRPGVPYDCVTVRVPPLICPEDERIRNSLYMSFPLQPPPSGTLYLTTFNLHHLFLPFAGS